MSWIHTFSGRKLSPLKLRPEDVCVQDLAHALSMKVRYTGHCPEFYSVAQHSVLVSLHVPPHLALAALCHDCAEAYLFDAARPIKQAVRFDVGQKWNGGRQLESAEWVEDGILQTIFEALHIDWPNASGWEEIKRADELLLTSEARDFFGHQELYQQWHHRPENGYPVLPYRIVPLPWRQARAEFLQRFAELTGGRVAVDEEPIETLWGEV